MNFASLLSLPVLVADIIVGPSSVLRRSFAGPSPVPPPPSELLPGHWAGSGFVSVGFWTMAVIAAGVLWWLRQRQSGTGGRDAVAKSN
jgi:hypothetical protein